MSVLDRGTESSTLRPGARLGPYEILASLGAGGMGEVYRARDERLGREVAVKVLPADYAADPDRLRRFEQEAKTAGALSHPNLVTVFDTGQHDGKPYVVFELLDGATLRQRLGPGLLPVRKALDYAFQIAQGLAAAHEKGIVHRDLKPENLFVTRDGRVKILDFGLAKLRPALDGHAGREPGAPPVSTATGPGVVLGTTGYMSPEQVRGDLADHRSDIFSFGAVLYEMLSGRRPFSGETAPEVMTAILKVDPTDMARPDVPPGLERVVRRCLEKRPEERFQSARDIAFALEALSSGSGSPPSTVIPARAKRRVLPGLIGTALMVGALAASFLVGKQAGDRPAPSFQRLSFRRGIAWSARFAPDGQTIVYGAAWEGKPIRLYSTRADSPESRLLDLPDADVLAISSSGEMAILLNRSALLYPQQSLGTLARASLAGGAPRQILEEVQGADWSPDGKELAVIREVGDRKRLEYPIGKVLYEGGHGLRTPRVSPRGDLVAFREDGIHVVDRAGKKRTLSADWGFGEGLAWSPKGDEVWFSASKTGIAQISLCAVTLSGRLRVVARFPLLFHLEDVSRDGRILASLAQVRNVLSGLAPGETQERELSWLDFPLPADLSADGKMLLFSEVGQGAGPQGAVYLRKTDGSSPAVKLGEGMAISLSGDSKWALARPFRAFAPTSELTLLPTGPGEPKVVKLEGIEGQPPAKLLPDGKRILVHAREPGGRWRAYVVDVAGGRPRPVTPEGVEPVSLSPDGRLVAAWNPDGKVIIYPVDGGDPRPLPGPPEPHWIGPWSGDGRFLFVAEWKGVDITIFRRDLATGRRERWREITQGDPAGILAMELRLGSDGRSYALKFHRQLSDLFLIEGLR